LAIAEAKLTRVFATPNFQRPPHIFCISLQQCGATMHCAIHVLVTALEM